MSEAMITRRGGGGGGRLQSKTVVPAATASIVSPDSGYDGLSSVTVAAITPQKEATSYTPGTADQTIAANQWLAGAQTIQGDANLLAANIKKGVSIFNVAGSYEASGLDTNSAILKVVTSTGCSVSVTNGTDTFTQQDADGFVRTGDANVTEHFFVIPTAAFGTFSVTSTHPTYGDNTKTNAVVIGNAGKIYEVLCGGKNVILSPVFGLQSGYYIDSRYFLLDDENHIKGRTNNGNFVPVFYDDGNEFVVPVEIYTRITCTALAASNSSCTMKLTDQGGRDIAVINGFNNSAGYRTLYADITNKRYPMASLRCQDMRFDITEIILT